MANKKKKSIKKKNAKNNNRIDIQSLLLIAIGVILSVVMYTEQHNIGQFVKEIILGGLMGKFAFALPIVLILLGIYIIFKDYSRFKVKPWIFVILVLSITGLFTCTDYIFSPEMPATNWISAIGEMCSEGTRLNGGGFLGAITAVPLIEGFGSTLAFVVYIILLIISFLTIFGIAFSTIIIGIFSFFKKVGEKSKEGAQNLASKLHSEDEYDEEEEEEEYEEEEIPVVTKQTRSEKANIKNKKFAQIMAQTEVLDSGKQISLKDLDLDDLEVDDASEEEEEDTILSNLDEEDNNEETEVEEIEEAPKTKLVKKRKVYKDSKAEEKQKDFKQAEVLDLNHGTIEDYSDYIFPPVSLLKEAEESNSDYSVKELREVASKLQKTLSSFNVDARVVNVTHGPSVTQYEVQPNVGVKVSKIINLENDIALNLAAKSIRIEAPIPGKSAVGIEVPNKTKEMVTLREVIESDVFQDASSKVTFALGKSIDGEPYVSDIAKMPHLLIAGATGSGKSVCINSILVSLLYKAKPNEVKLIMIDPKRVELGVYNDIPHLLIPVVTDPKKAAGALNWAVQEMVNRYNLFAAKGVRDIRGYNDQLIQEGEEGILPQIVIIVDELADLMMVAPSEVEDSIVRLTQMARAAGMHLIIATQRPTVDVVTGIIKANVPSRIAFTVTSQVDSRTILDMAGAEKLLGKGDMLYYPIGESKPIRLQGTFVSDKEVEQIVDFVKEQNPEVKYNEDVIESFEKANQPPQAQQEQQDTGDELLPDAIELAVQMGNASASMFQRKFKIGYARAGRIVDQMEERGIVSGYDGSKPRQVLISKEEWEEMKEAGVDSVRYEDIDENADYEYVDVDEDEEEDENAEYEYVEVPVDEDGNEIVEEDEEEEEEEEEETDEDESEEVEEEEDDASDDGIVDLFDDEDDENS